MIYNRIKDIKNNNKKELEFTKTVFVNRRITQSPNIGCNGIKYLMNFTKELRNIEMLYLASIIINYYLYNNIGNDGIFKLANNMKYIPNLSKIGLESIIKLLFI